MRIERYNDKYKAQVIALILDIQQNEFNVPVTLKDQPDLEDVEKFYFNDNSHFWLAIDSNEVVGTIALIDFGNRQGALRKMFVHKNFRGKDKGIAQNLLDILVAWCIEKRIVEVYLGTVDILIAAQKFYIKNGFVKISKNQLPATFPLMQVDTIFFQKILEKK